MRGAVVRGPGGTDGARMGTPAARGVMGCSGPAARGGVGCAGLAARGDAVCCGVRAALDIRRRAARRAAFLIYKLPPKAASL